MKIGDKIKIFRKEKGLTQLKLSTQANISRSYLADIENNRYNPSIDVVKNIADALSIPVDEFFKEEVSEKPIDKIDRLIDKNKIHTIAAHFDGEEFTDDDVEDIENFIKFVLAKKKK